MIFHRGIAPEHRSCTAGDSEMRFAFETYMTLQDAGERARPRTLASERLRAASKAESSNTGMDDTHRRTPSHTSNLTQEPAQLGEDGDGDSLYAQSLTETSSTASQKTTTRTASKADVRVHAHCTGTREALPRSRGLGR